MPKADLPIYRGVSLWFSIIVAVWSFGGAGSFSYAIVFLIFGFPFIAFYLQHETAMNKAKRTSCITLGVFLFLAVYNTIITLLYSFQIMKDWINHEECTVVSEDSYVVEDISLPGKHSDGCNYIIINNYQLGFLAKWTQDRNICFNLLVAVELIVLKTFCRLWEL